MKKNFYLASLIIFTLIFGSQNISFAEEILIEASGDYIIDLRVDETFASGTARAREDAGRQAIDKAGVYIQAYSKTVDLALESDEVRTVTAHLLKIQDEAVYAESAGENLLKITVNIKALVDNDINDEILKTLMQDKQSLEEATEKYLALQKQYDELQSQMENLKQNYSNSNVKQKAEIRQAVAQNSKYFEAVQALERGNDFYLRKEYQKAKASYLSALQLNPNSAEAYNNLGNTYVALKNYSEAENCFVNAVNLNPNDARIHNNLGGIYILSNLYDEAIKEYTWAIKFNPNQPIFYYNRALAYYQEKSYKKALADLERAIELDPNDIDAKNLYTKINKKLN